MYTVSEKRALKKLGIPDFRHMTSEKIVEFVNMAPHMNPEVVKAAINQFPEFKDMAIQMTTILKDIVEKSFDAEKNSQDYFYQSCNGVLDTLRIQLQDTNIDAEERAQINANMANVLVLISKKDTEHKEFVEHMTDYTVKAILGIAGIGLAVLGGIIKLPVQNFLKSHDEDNDNADE